MSNPIERLTNSVIGGDSKKAALIVSETNLYYLTAFPSTDGALLLTSEQAYYLLDFRYTEAARAKAQNVEVVEFTSLNETYKTLLKSTASPRCTWNTPLCPTVMRSVLSSSPKSAALRRF